MGWLTNLTNWLKEQIVAVWHAFTTFINDTLVAALQTVADAVIYVLNHIPMPDWLAQYSLCALLSDRANGDVGARHVPHRRRARAHRARLRVPPAAQVRDPLPVVIPC